MPTPIRLASQSNIPSLRPGKMQGSQAASPQKQGCGVLTVCCFKWFHPNGRYNNKFIYGPAHVNRLKNMVERHLSLPHEFVCITDDAEGLDSAIRPIEIDRDLLAAGRRFPKLMIFRPDAAEWLGERILMFDLDTVIVETLDPILDISSDFVAWQEPNWKRKAGVGKFNTSMVLLRAGSHPEVWQAFQNGDRGLPNPTEAGHSDQAVVSRAIGDAYPTWGREDGVYSFRADIARYSFPRLFGPDHLKPTRLPPRAKIVFFHGAVDPSQAAMQAAHPWIRENWQ